MIGTLISTHVVPPLVVVSVCYQCIKGHSVFVYYLRHSGPDSKHVYPDAIALTVHQNKVIALSKYII